MSMRFHPLLLALSLLAGQATRAQHDGHELTEGHASEGVHEMEEESGFDPSPFIIHHVADAHDIHLWGEGESASHSPSSHSLLREVRPGCVHEQRIPWSRRGSNTRMGGMKCRTVTLVWLSARPTLPRPRGRTQPRHEQSSAISASPNLCLGCCSSWRCSFLLRRAAPIIGRIPARPHRVDQRVGAPRRLCARRHRCAKFGREEGRKVFAVPPDRILLHPLPTCWA